MTHSIQSSIKSFLDAPSITIKGYLSIHYIKGSPSICQSIYWSIHWSIPLSICPSINPPVMHLLKYKKVDKNQCNQVMRAATVHGSADRWPSKPCFWCTIELCLYKIIRHVMMAPDHPSWYASVPFSEIHLWIYII